MITYGRLQLTRFSTRGGRCSGLLTKQEPLHLAARRLWQLVHEMDRTRVRVCGELILDELLQLALQHRRRLRGIVENHERDQDLTAQLVGQPDDRRLGDGGVAAED